MGSRSFGYHQWVTSYFLTPRLMTSSLSLFLFWFHPIITISDRVSLFFFDPDGESAGNLVLEKKGPYPVQSTLLIWFLCGVASASYSSVVFLLKIKKEKRKKMARSWKNEADWDPHGLWKNNLSKLHISGRKWISFPFLFFLPCASVQSRVLLLLLLYM